MIDVVEEARSWLGTPYHHQASVKGVGADCLGLIRGVWRAVHGDEPEAMPAYTSEWAETGGVETLLEAARRHLKEKYNSCSPLVGELSCVSMTEGGIAPAHEFNPPQPPFGRQLPRKGGAGELTPGDILLFRMRPKALVKHIGIYVGHYDFGGILPPCPPHFVAGSRPLPNRKSDLGYFIHAYEHAGVVEQELTDFWRSKIAAVFGWG